MKKKIGIIGQFPPPIHGLSKALDTLYNSYLNENFNFIKFNISNNKKFLLNFIKILFSNCDLYYLTIAQSQLGNIRDLLLIKLIQIKKRKIIIHLHGGGFRRMLDNEFNPILKKINYRILSKVDGGIVLGESLKWIFKDIIPEEKIYVVKNCADDEFVINDNKFKEKIHNISEKKSFNVLYLSNFMKEKGYKYVLELAKYVSDIGDNKFKFIFAGKFFDECSKNEFEEYIKTNKLEDIVEYKGIVYGEEKKNLLECSDIFVLLTTHKDEGQPISIIEAIANGLLVTTTNRGGILDIVDDTYSLIYDTKDIQIKKIYLDIVDFINNKDDLKSALIKAKQIYMKEFTEQKYLDSINEIFNK